MSPLAVPLDPSLAESSTRVVPVFQMNGISYNDNEPSAMALDTQQPQLSQPVHEAVKSGHHSTVQLLLRLQPSTLDIKDSRGRTPLSFAASNGYVDIAKTLLMAGADYAICDNHGDYPMHRAAENGNTDMLQLLMDHLADIQVVNNSGFTGLFIASQHGHSAAVALLLSRGADPNVVSVKWRRCALHQAAQNGHVEIVQLLISHGADIHALEARDATPLWLASQGGHTDIVRMLLEKGAAVDSRLAGTYHTPLHMSCQNGHLQTSQLLVA